MATIWTPQSSPLSSTPINGQVLNVDVVARTLTVQMGDNSVDGVGWHGADPIEGDLVYVTDTGVGFVAVKAGIDSELAQGGVWFTPIPPGNPDEGQIWIDSAHPCGDNLLPIDYLTNTARWQWQAAGYAAPAGVLTVEPTGMRVEWQHTVTAGSGGMVAIVADAPFTVGAHLYGVVTVEHDGIGAIHATYPYAFSGDGVPEGDSTATAQWVVEVGTAQAGGLFGPQLTLQDSADQVDIGTSLVTEAGVYDLATATFEARVWTGDAWVAIGQCGLSGGGGNEVVIDTAAPHDEGVELWVDLNSDTGNDSAYVLKAGDTMSGNLSVVNPSAHAFITSKATGSTLDAVLRASSPAGRNAGLEFTSGDLLRWKFYKTASAETGANAGSDLYLARYDDAGAWMGTVLWANRASNVVTFAAQPGVNGGTANITPAAGWAVASGYAARVTQFGNLVNLQVLLSRSGANIDITAWTTVGTVPAAFTSDVGTQGAGAINGSVPIGTYVSAGGTMQVRSSSVATTTVNTGWTISMNLTWRAS